MTGEKTLKVFFSLILLFCLSLFPFHFVDYDQFLNLYFNLRLPRLLMALVAGGGLSICGYFYQGIFKNELATPFTLGLSSGVAFGVGLSFVFGLQQIHFILPFPFLFGLGGGVGTVFILIMMARFFSGGERNLSFLLFGLMLSFLFSSGLLFLQFLLEPFELAQMTYWLLGNISTVGYRGVLMIFLSSGLGIFLLSRKSQVYDGFLLGDDFLFSKGHRPEKEQIKIALISTLILAPLVAECGPIGFVGLIIPHFFKARSGLSFQYSAFSTVIWGGIFLCFCDQVARVLSFQGPLPVGILTSLVGVPCFLGMIIRRHQGFKNP